MTSECPSCHKQIEHEDYLFEVHCDACSCRFNPFMGSTEDLGVSEASPPAKEDSAATEPTTGKTDFTESLALFQEIREFGENIGTPPEKAASPAVSAAKTVAPMKAAAKVIPATEVSPGPAEEFPVTFGDALPGFAVDTYLPPLSAIANIETGAEHPLKTGFDEFLATARGQGATAVVTLRCFPLPDGVRVLIVGTPVRANRTP